MKRQLILAAIVAALPGMGAQEAQAQFENRPLTSNAFTPTGYTLNQGEVTLGLGPIGFGLTDRVQVETNLLLWALQVYNADLKLAIVKTEKTALAVGITAARQSADFVDAEDVPFKSYSPYISLSRRLGTNTLAHIGARRASFSNLAGRQIDDAEPSGTATGTGIFGGIQHGIGIRTKLLGDVGYDTTFDGLRVGGAALFGWDTFRLKLGLSYSTADDGFVLPIVGFRWRFQG